MLGLMLRKHSKCLSLKGWNFMGPVAYFYSSRTCFNDYLTLESVIHPSLNTFESQFSNDKNKGCQSSSQGATIPILGQQNTSK